MAEVAIKEALSRDYWSADLHRALAGYLYMQNKIDEAKQEAEIVVKISHEKGVQIRVFNYQ